MRRPVLLLAVGALTIGCKGGAAASDDAPPAVVNASTIVVTPQGFTETAGSIGVVVGRAGHVATLSAAAPGRIASVEVSTGQTVAVGQTLVTLDPATFEAALHSAQIAVDAAQKNYDRSERLANEGIVPRKDAETAAADLARARSDLTTAERQASLATLRSPIAGVVTKMNATLGASADPSQPLVEISDPRALDVLLTLTASQAGRVQRGATVNISAGQSATGDPLGIGRVSDIGATIDTTTRGVQIRVQAPATRRPLKIGETVFGQIAVATIPNAIVVPLDALVPEGETYKVFVVDATNVSHAREVKVGGRTDKVAEITEGLKAGERIVTTGAYGMSDSAKVQPLRPAPAPAPATKTP
ncbi:MAG TPA: efflux RND transporter periplasmic adaptor subunit [Gemmatimonadaceae bacterium]|nr:efflux RND transporter periplasmic adaptor subunit [Gemmatimonadaceae bacterium]